MNKQVPRIGCVPYLNARPLLEGITYPIRELVPAKLGEAFQDREFDAALLSSIDVLANSDPCAVDGISISSRGDVFSVVLVYHGDLKEITKVTLDPASHTSNALLRIILEDFHGINPEYVQYPDSRAFDRQFAHPTLLIGDRAIEARKRTSMNTQFLDLGGNWFLKTGLPFVFALWSLGNDYTEKSKIATLLRQAKDRGIDAIGRIAADTPEPEFTKRYLGGMIRYELGEEEKRGLELFGDYLRKKGIATIRSEIKYY